MSSDEGVNDTENVCVCVCRHRGHSSKSVGRRVVVVVQER